MLKASSRGVTFLAVSVLLAQAVVLLPTATGAPPQPVFQAPYDVKNEITGFDLDAQGRYAAVVVNINPLAGLTQDEYDVYLFDLTSTGLQWRTRHETDARATQIQTGQSVSVGKATGQSVSDPAVFHVGGPGALMSRWNSNGPTPTYDRRITSDANGHLNVVATSGDGKRVAFGHNTQTAGRLFFMDAERGGYLWDLNVTDGFGTPLRITTLEFARNSGANLLVLGHEKGVWFIPTTNAKPAAEAITRYTTIGRVTDTDVSRDGNFIVVGTDNGASSGYVYYFPMQTSKESPFNRGFASRVTSVAMSLDGRYFAAGTGVGEVHFFERGADSSVLAQFREDPRSKTTKFTFQGGKPIVSLDYDSSGATLVATTDLEVAGFHTSTHAPIWRATSTQIGVGAPLKGALVSDSGERILVAGRTHVTALRTSFDANVTVPGGLVRSGVPGDTVRYDVNIKNVGSAPDTYTFKVQLPAGGWTSDPLRTVTLLPEETVTLKLNLTSPTGAPPGSAITKLTVESQGRKDNPRPGLNPAVGTFEMNVTLQRVNNIRLESSERSLTLNQGQDATFAFTIRNLGNAPAQVNMTSVQNPSRGSTWNVRFEPERVTIAPGATETATAIVTAPQDAQDGDSNSITIRARVGTSYQSDLVVVGRVNPVYRMEMTANATTVATEPGKAASVKLTLRNMGNTLDTVNLTAVVLPEAARLDWRVDIDYPTLDVRRGDSRTVTLHVRSLVREPEVATVTVTMTTLNGNERSAVTIQMEQSAGGANVGFFERLTPAPAGLPLVVALAAAALLAGAFRRRETR